MVMNIIDQRNGQFVTYRQKVGYGIAYIIIFQGQAAAHILREIRKNPAETLQS